ncbi:uncharacterized protein LOC141664585 [Apium graveolens]|uniref:uncharacterized protein LOC141664585 n=1 Tax=Apium graveolens TaxID=4045 RepID=UPI003D7C106C
MLDKNNELVKAFRMAQNRFENEDLDEFKLVLISSQSSSGRPNHITPSDEVVAFIVSDDTDTGGSRDTGTDGYHKRIPLISNKYSEIENLDDGNLDPDSTQRRHVSLRDKGDQAPMHVGKAVILPASFTGSQRYMSQYFKDSLAICRAIGHPSLFLTMTCNSKWPEIQEILKLLPNVDPVDAPDIISRVFKLKLDQLLDLIKKKNYFGKCTGVMHVIEFQKRGLPHVHMLIWLSPESRPNFIEKVDQFNGNTYFDDCGFPVYWRRNTGRVINKKGINLDNQYVVPYNRDLLLRFQCHINLEICNSSRSLKYLFKYCLKSHDTAIMLLKKKINKSGNEQTARSVKNLDEVKNFLDGRYVCASEASWRILGLTFTIVPQVLNAYQYICPKTAKWKIRQRGDVVGRSAEVHVTTGELLYLRMPLLRYKGALSFTQLRTIDRTTYDTFKESCGALALSDDILYIRRKISDNIHLTLSEYEIQNYALAEIEKLLNDILPVLPKAGRAEIVNAPFNKYWLWKSCKVFLLSQNMRLHSGNSEPRNKVIADFSKWQLEIGDGRVECIVTHRADVETEFNNLHSHEYLRPRSILTPTNVVVDDINAQILERVPGNVHTYLSQDSIEDRGVDDNDFDSSFPVEYLNSINMPCMPKHELKVKNLAEMEALMFEHILSLDKSRSDWKIKARVTRMWPTVSSESGITKGWNLILLDDDVTT